MRSKSVVAVVLSLVLVGLMLALAACSKEPAESGSKDKSGASQPASPAPAPSPAPSDTPAPAAAQEPAPTKDAPPAQDAAPAPGKLNAAEFLTKGDAEAILGKPVADPTVVGDGTITSNVSYIATADFSGLSLFVRAGTGPQTFEKARASSKTIAEVDPVTISGLGESAYWSGGKMNQLHVLKNGYWLIIMVPSAKEKSLDMAKQAAEKILPRIP